MVHAVGGSVIKPVSFSLLQFNNSFMMVKQRRRCDGRSSVDGEPGNMEKVHPPNQAADHLHHQAAGHLLPQAAGQLHCQAAGHLHHQSAGHLHHQSAGHLLPQAAGHLHPQADGHLHHQSAGHLHHQAAGHLHPQADGHLHHQSAGHLHHQADGHLHHQSAGHLHHQADGHLHHQADGHLHHQSAGHLHHQAAGHLLPQADGHLHPQAAGHLHHQSAGHLHHQADGHLLPQADGHLHPQAAGHLHHQSAGHLHHQADGHLHQQAAGHLHHQADGHLHQQSAGDAGDDPGIQASAARSPSSREEPMDETSPQAAVSNSDQDPRSLKRSQVDEVGKEMKERTEPPVQVPVNPQLLQELNQVMSKPLHYPLSAAVLEECVIETPLSPEGLLRFFQLLHKKSDKGMVTSGSSSHKTKKSSSSKGWVPRVYTVKVFSVSTGQTCGAADEMLEKVKNIGWSTTQVEITTDSQGCDIIIIFCPISSRVGSDVEAALRRSQGQKRAIVVLMHHTRDVDYSTNNKRWCESSQNVVLEVNVLFHETQPGLLRCRQNDQAVQQIQDVLKQHSKWR